MPLVAGPSRKQANHAAGWAAAWDAMTAEALLLADAFRFAAEAHANQRRKGAAQEPYINHLAEVAGLVADATDGGDPEAIVAALLHDAIEDAGVTAATLAERFGPRVAEIVLECSDDMSLPKAERRRRRIAQAPHKSPGAKLVKLADCISNLRCMAESPPAGWPAAWRLGYLDGMRELFAGLKGGNARLDALFLAQAERTEAAVRALAITEETGMGSPTSQVLATGEPVHLVYLANTEDQPLDAAARARLAAILAERFPSVTIQDGQGLYEGRLRPILVLRIRCATSEPIIALAQHLCIAFGQRFVGVEIDDHYQRVYADDTGM